MNGIIKEHGRKLETRLEIQENARNTRSTGNYKNLQGWLQTCASRRHCILHPKSRRGIEKKPLNIELNDMTSTSY